MGESRLGVRFGWGCVAIAALALGCSSAKDDASTPSRDDGGTGRATIDAAVASGPSAAPESTPATATTEDAAAPRVPIFLAQGKLGRTTISCDDGRTWIADHSENPTGRCWDDASPNDVECDHDRWSSVGVLDADGTFLATYGWGYPGVVRRTEDGVHWEDVLSGHTFAGMAFGDGRVIANDHTPMISTSGGVAGSWDAGAPLTSTGWTVRTIAFVPDGGGRFVITLDGEVMLSDDDGASWREAANVPAECAKAVRRVLHGNGVTVMFQSDGSVCRSVDRGDHWDRVTVTDAFGSTPLFADGTFMVWTGSTRWQSHDGLHWTSTPGTPGVAIGAVARAASGTFVAVRDGWQVWYEKQQFYRSADGVTWEVLPQTAFNPSHPITHIVAGFAKPSAACPLR